MFPEAYGVREFCASHSISRALFYKLVRSGRGPSTIKVGRRTLVTRAAAAEWISRLERDVAKGA